MVLGLAACGGQTTADNGSADIPDVGQTVDAPSPDGIPRNSKDWAKRTPEEDLKRYGEIETVVKSVKNPTAYDGKTSSVTNGYGTVDWSTANQGYVTFTAKVQEREFILEGLNVVQTLCTTAKGTTIKVALVDGTGKYQYAIANTTNNGKSYRVQYKNSFTVKTIDSDLAPFLVSTPGGTTPTPPRPPSRPRPSVVDFVPVPRIAVVDGVHQAVDIRSHRIPGMPVIAPVIGLRAEQLLVPLLPDVIRTAGQTPRRVHVRNRPASLTARHREAIIKYEGGNWTMDYILMNKDDKLLAFRTETGPLGTTVTETASYGDRRPHGWAGIKQWIDSRNYAKHKDHFRSMLKEWQLDTPDGFLQVSHALGLNDTLWVKPAGSALAWADVSLYSVQFDDVAARTAFETGLHGLRLSSTSPEFTSEGTYPKCWRREPDGILLYKTGSEGFSNAGLEPYSEFMAARIAGRMRGVDAVEYGLAKFKGKLCSTCRLFTDESTGFVPAYKVFPRDSVGSIADALALCRDMGFEREFADMVVLDAVTLNQDRHLGNFGFLIDNDTFEVKSFAPLFDFNRSLLCFATDGDLETDLSLSDYMARNDVGHMLGGDFGEVARVLMTPERRERMPRAVALPRHYRYNLPDGRMERLDVIFERNYEYIRNGRGPGLDKAMTAGHARGAD